MQDFAAFMSAGGTPGELESQLEQEWLAVNHLGGYASSTLPSVNTRKYHGLLVAAMSPPVQRMVLLSRVEETVVRAGWSFPLACNQYPNSFFPRGDQSLIAFRPDPFPRWAYRGDGWTIEKSLRLLDGQNTVVLSYSLLGGDSADSVEFQLRPMFALRGIHELMYQWNGHLSAQELIPGHHCIPATGRTPEVFFAHDGVFENDAHWYLNSIYRREQERGYSGLEDVWNAGVIRWSLKPGQTVHFACSTALLELDEAIQKADYQFSTKSASANGLDSLAADDRLAMESLLHAADQFVLSILRSDGKTKDYVAANYPWSPPSPRHSLLGFTGLFLVPGKFGHAKDFLLGMRERLTNGVLPSAFSETGGRAEYNGVDTSLWYINAIYAYHQYTGDTQTIIQLYDTVMQIIRWYRDGTSLGIRADVDGLLQTNQPGLPTTWMDAKADGWVVTPRGGKAVEINALWYNALRIAIEFSEKVGRFDYADELSKLATFTQAAFNTRFWNNAAGCCYDVVDDMGADPSIRPNQLLAISLPFPVLAAARFEHVLEKARQELLTPMGIRTLSPSDHNYAGHYAGHVVQRDRAYHQGSAFPWLLGPYVDAYLKVHGNGEGARSEAKELLSGCIKRMHDSGLGQICELFDGDAPHRAGGAIALAISVAEILRVLSHDILNLQPTPAKSENATTQLPTHTV